jgi:tight adherence protein C
MIETLNTMLRDALGPLGPLLAVGGLGLLLVLLALPALIGRRPDPLVKLREAAQAKAVPAAGAPRLRIPDRSDKLQKFATFLEPQDEKELTTARLKMLRAGYRSKNAVRMFHAAQFVLGLGALLVGVVYTMLTNDPANPRSTSSLLISTMLPGAIGYYAPIYWVQRRIQERQQQMIEGFPDALDMMLVCVEAGQSLDQSIVRVAKEIRLGYPALGEEFELVAHEVKAGKERVQVLRDFAERAGVPDIASFVTTMVQSAQFGTSIAEALRIYASEMRDKRVMRAEEKANILPTKLTLGTMLFTVPPLMIILIGPSLHGIAKTLGGSF